MIQHPITPPADLINQWYLAWDDKSSFEHCLIEAARWGADQKLDACVQHVRDHQWGFVGRSDGTKVHTAVDLQLARRPRLPNLKEQALAELDLLRGDANAYGLGFDTLVIRRALEALPDE